MTGIVVDITEDHAPPGGRSDVLWHIGRAPAPSTLFELRAWFVDHVTREYYESQRPLLAVSFEGALNLLPHGFFHLPDSVTGSDWFAAPPVRRRNGIAA